MLWYNRDKLGKEWKVHSGKRFSLCSPRSTVKCEVTETAFRGVGKEFRVLVQRSPTKLPL